MRRRGFLGFLGGVAMAGPSMARAAVTPVTEALSIPGVGLSSVYANGPVGAPDPAEVAGEVLRLRSMLSRLAGKSAAELLRERKQVSVHVLDPDLAAMRSMSLDYRMRVQRERNFAIMQEQERGWIEQRINELLSS